MIEWAGLQSQHAQERPDTRPLMLCLKTPWLKLNKVVLSWLQLYYWPLVATQHNLLYKNHGFVLFENATRHERFSSFMLLA